VFVNPADTTPPTWLFSSSKITLVSERSAKPAAAMPPEVVATTTTSACSTAKALETARRKGRRVLIGEGLPI
jgi:hypothetical protein